MVKNTKTPDPDSVDRLDLLSVITDPVERLLLTGRAKSVHDAEEMYLDSANAEVLALLASPLSDEELGRHPLLVLYRSHGRRPREDSCNVEGHCQAGTR